MVPPHPNTEQILADHAKYLFRSGNQPFAFQPATRSLRHGGRNPGRHHQYPQVVLEQSARLLVWPAGVELSG